MTEFELKFQVPAAQRADVARAVRRGRSRQMRLRAAYFDTDDGRLAAHGIALRLRLEGDRWVQTAKARGPSLLERHEHNVDRPSPAAEPPQPDLSLHEGTPVGKLIFKALGKRRPPALVPVYATEVVRTTREIREGSTMVELAFDEGQIVAGSSAIDLCELEFELKEGDAWVVLELARGWMLRHLLWLDTVSKAERGERLGKGLETGPARKAEPPALQPSMAGAAMLHAVVSACLAQILPNASEVAGGRGQAEHVHQLRVGLRRLRTALRELAGFGAGVDPAWEPVLSAAFRALGEHRDRDHLVKAVQPQLAAAGGPAIDWDAGRKPPADPQETAQAAELQGVLLDLIRFTLAPLPASTREARGADRKALEDRLRKLHKQVKQDGKQFAALEPEQRHRLRKRGKRLRYLAEFVAPLYGGHASVAYLAALEPAQDALGEYNDLAVAQAAARAVAAHDPHAWFAVGWLAARQEAGIGACRKALAKVGDAEPFWKSHER